MDGNGANSGATSGANSGGKINFAIHLRIFLVIIVAAIVIIVSGLAAGAGFLSRSITSAIEDDMLVAVDIADLYVTNEIEILKYRAAEAAAEANMLLEAGETDVLKHVCTDHPLYFGMAIYDEKNLLDSWGDIRLPPDLYREPFMLTAFAGGQAVSTTMFTLDEKLVMYVSVPLKDGHVLVAVLPGLYFSNLISEFTFWQTGHFFIDDEDGYVISNYRREWVQQRINFIERAKTDHNYIDAAKMVERGVAGERGVGQFSMAGVPRIGAFRPISSETENWFIGIIAPLSESAMSNIPGGLLLIGMIALVMSIIAAIFGSIWLKRPYVEVDRLRREAEIASISKSTFLANMSHEIRTPMNSIVGFSELAMDGDISDKTKDYLEKIMANAEWLLQIINDILDISKIESGKMELENIPFDIHEMFASCRTLIMPKAAEKGIMLHFYAEPSLGKRPLGDPTRLRQVFVNLLSNAIKFTNSGMVKLYSEILEKGENTIRMRFEIRDSGIGMTGEQMEKIFSPFTQAESGTTRKYGGTGLGLTITKNIVEMMGGRLAVESSPGVGSKFSFELVFDTIDVSADEAFENKIILHDFEKPSFEGEVLLCEDNVMNQQVICEHLSRVGLKTVVAENGRLGLDLVRERKEKGEKQFDLIFMDMHMPVMDGLEASSKILKLETGIPIVALTANIMSNDREIYREYGMFDCVGKPFTSQELWRCLMKYLTPLSVADTSKGVQLEADTDFMKNIKIMFYNNNLNKYEEIVKALEDNDIKLAHRLVHTLKSNAGQIGKAVLQKVAAVVEKQLKDGKNKVSKEQLKIFETELVMVLNEIAPMAEEEKKRQNINQTVVFLDREKALEVLGGLEPFVKSGNPDSLKFIDEIRMIKDGEELAKQIEDFDFEKAYATLLKLIERTDKDNE